MRAKHVATALAVVAAGMTAAAAVRRLAARRRHAAVLAARPVHAPVAPRATAAVPPVSPLVRQRAEVAADAVVLPFPRRPLAEPAPETATPAQPPARCGDSGGRTKAGAPCAARATSGGRCHHHRLTA